MNILIVNDEPLALENMIDVVEQAAPQANLFPFSDPLKAEAKARETSMDVAFLDISMRGMSGLDLSKRLTGLKRDTNIIMTTGYNEYMEDAFAQHVSGYIMKPVTLEKVKNELQNLRHAITERPLLTIRAFGNFDVFCGSAPIKFKYTKSRELMAYLVDRRGSFVTNQEAIAVLWEEEEDGHDKTSYLQNIKRDLLKTLENVGCGNAVIAKRNRMAINLEAVSCDFYAYMKGDKEARNLYRGEYMSQYSWAEITHASIPE